MDTKQSLANVITEAIEACYPGVDGLPDASAIADMLEIPPQKEMGDYAFPCFKLSRALHMGPPQIAGNLAGAISAGHLCEAEQQGGYLNFFLNRDEFRPGNAGNRTVRRGKLRRAAGRRGKDHLPGLFLHQYRQAVPYRPPEHHHAGPQSGKRIYALPRL